MTRTFKTLFMTTFKTLVPSLPELTMTPWCIKYTRLIGCQLLDCWLGSPPASQKLHHQQATRPQNKDSTHKDGHHWRLICHSAIPHRILLSPSTIWTTRVEGRWIIASWLARSSKGRLDSPLLSVGRNQVRIVNNFLETFAPVLLRWAPV